MNDLVKFILITGVFVMSNPCQGQNDLYQYARRLESIHYYIKQDFECTRWSQDGLYCVLMKEQDCFYSEVLSDNMKLDSSELIGIRQVFVKADYKLSNSYYPRAHLREWVLSDSLIASEVMNCLDLYIKESSATCTKAPYDYFKRGRRIYFLISGGNYMMDVFPKIKSAFRSAICGSIARQ